MQQSSTTRYLKGKTLPGMQKPVKTVEKFGDRRIVISEGGERMTLSKKQLNNKFHSVMAQQQKAAVIEVATHHRDGTVTVPIGGEIKGTPKRYASEASMKSALGRLYGK